MQNTNHIETKTNTASRQWLVAYVQSCLEKKTAQRLAAMGIGTSKALPFNAK